MSIVVMSILLQYLLIILILYIITVDGTEVQFSWIAINAFI